tara:strand:+ start:1996 stop:2592 length:597 start_codon:yes stop_codon:yes gene_type:complete
MDIQTNHRVTLLNAKCNYVCAVDILQKKMSYGEDVSCCINKLYLAQKLIGRLECFCFETPVYDNAVSAEFTFTVANNFYLPDTILQLVVNGVQVATKIIEKDPPRKPISWSELLDSVNINYELVNNVDTATFTLIMPCNITEITGSITVISEMSSTTTSGPLTNTVVGVCEVPTPPCYNCIENSDLPKMYEVLHKLLQ